MYADDTILLVSDKNLDKMSADLSCAVEKCHHWMTNNRLSMHMGKTEAIIMTSKRKLPNIKNVVIKCKGFDIKPSCNVKYLGLNLDQTLSGENTVCSIVKKCTSRLKFMYRHKDALNLKARKLLTAELIQCLFDYAASSWYTGTSAKLKHKLQVAQNKVARFVLGLGPRSHIGQMELSSIGVLNTSDRVKQLTLWHMFNIFSHSAPIYLQDNFTRMADQSCHNTRRSEFNFFVPRVNGASSNSFTYHGAKLWNDLPKSIQASSSKPVFKKLVKGFLHEKSLAVERSDFVYQ